MRWEDLKRGDALLPVAGEEQEWRHPHLVLGVRTSGWVVTITFLSLEDAEVRTLTFGLNEPVNAMYDVVLVAEGK